MREIIRHEKLQVPVFIFAVLFVVWVGIHLGIGAERAKHDCPEPDHIPCEIAIDGLTEGLRLSRVAFGDAVDQFNECNKELRICRGYLPPIGSEKE